MRGNAIRYTRGFRCLFLLTGLIAGFHAPSCSPRRPVSYEPSYKGAKRIEISAVRFDDGDTFYLNARPLRILGIDTPEIANPDVGIFYDQPYGRAAAESTRAIISRARIVEVVPDGNDRYGRLLAHVFVDGELLGVRLIRLGLAYETVSFYGDSGFPDLAQQILDASRTSAKPKFEPPYRWKRKHQRKIGR